MNRWEHLRAAQAERFEIGREIGSGGRVTACLAEDVKHRRRVAVKVLKPAVSRRPGRRPWNSKES
jgi:serine/threonine-protein kinase